MPSSMSRRGFLATGAGVLGTPALVPLLGTRGAPSAVGHGETTRPAATGDPNDYELVWDDFSSGFSTTGPGAKWSVFQIGTFPQGDGIPATGADGLEVVPTGTNPSTGEPAFAWTTGQEHTGGQGAADHAKWYAAANHTSSAGFAGFDAPEGCVLSFGASIRARTFGTEQHPFGAEVADPETDLRLAAAAFAMIDRETNVVFDFFITNHRVYAFYERLPVAGSTYASFSYAMPSAYRTPDQWHDLAVRYDRSAGVATWYVDGEAALTVDRLGFIPDRTNLLLDLGGTQQSAAPRQLSAGFGTFTLLDDKGPDGRGLVRISDQESYYAPDLGSPNPQQFFDGLSLPANRLWGQGAQLETRYLTVSCHPRGTAA